MEGGAVYGLTAALLWRDHLDKGRVQQTNFHDYPMMRIDEIPVIEVLSSGRARRWAGSESRACPRSRRPSATPSSPRPASASGDCRFARKS